MYTDYDVKMYFVLWVTLQKNLRAAGVENEENILENDLIIRY